MIKSVVCNRKLVTFFVLASLLVSCFASLYIPEVSAQGGVTWTYNAGTDTATAGGAGTTNFAAIVAADTAGGWGQFTSDATGAQVSCAAKIVIGDGTNATVFTDTNKQIILTYAVDPQIYISANSSFILGTAINTTLKTSKDGCTIQSLSTASNYYILDSAATSTVYLYSCTLIGGAGANNRISDIDRLWNSFLGKNMYIRAGNKNIDVYNIISCSSSSLLYNPNAKSVTYDKITALNIVGWGLYATANLTVRNIEFISEANTIYLNGMANGTKAYFVNCESSVWHMGYSAATTAQALRQYEFDLSVLNGEITDFVNEANVTLTKGSQYIGSWLTNTSGQINTQTLTYGFYDQAHGDTIQNATDPFTLTVTHPDWDTYTSKFYVTEKTKITISMQNQTIIPTTNYTVARFNWTPTNPSSGQVVTFDASTSSNSSNINWYNWDINGTIYNYTVPTVTHAFSDFGVYNVNLTISASSLDSVVQAVTVGSEDEFLGLAVAAIVLVVLVAVVVTCIFILKRRE